MKPQKLRILTGVATALAGDKKLLKAVSVFYAFKSLYKSGVILDYHSKKKTLAEAIGRSEKTLFTHLQELKKVGLVTEVCGRVHLASYDKLHELLKIEVHKQRYRYVKVTTQPEYILRSLAIKENYDRQRAAIKGKLERLNESSGLSGDEIEHRKEADLKRLIVQFKNSAPLRWDASQMVLYNPDVAISQKRLARMYGLKSQTSGWYWQKVLKKKKLIEVENRIVEGNGTNDFTPLGQLFRSRQGFIYCCQMPNKISFL